MEMLGLKPRQIPPDLVVKSQVTDIIDIILQLIRRPNGVHRAWRNRKSRSELLSTPEVQWSTTKSDGVCNILCLSLKTGSPNPVTCVYRHNLSNLAGLVAVYLTVC